MIEVSKALRDQEQTQIIERAQKAILTNANDLFNAKYTPIAGNPNGDVNVVEFFDYQCIHCRDMTPIVDKLLGADKNIRFIFKELPIFGAESQNAAKAALAAKNQGKYMEMHDALMNAGKPLTNDKVMAAAKSVGLDTDQLAKDMKSKAIDEELNNNFKLAQSLGVMGTPAFIVASNPATDKTSFFVPGATSQSKLQSLINQARSK